MSASASFPELNFPPVEFRFRQEQGINKIFDPVRKKFVALTPEEWVRQHVIAYLHGVKFYPLSLLMVEKEFTLNRLTKRADIVACSNSGKPLLIVECKSFNMAISQDTFDQAVRYNMQLHVRYLLITNGMNTFCCSLENGNYVALVDIPDYRTLATAKV